MEKNMTINTACSNQTAFVSTLMTILSSIVCGFVEPVVWLRQYYSHVLEREVSMRQTWLLINVQAAFAMTFFPADCTVAYRLVCGMWLAGALWMVKRAF